MKRVWNRLMTYRINKELWKKMITNQRMGTIDQDNHKLIVLGANLVFITFLIRLFSRIWISGNAFFIRYPLSNWVTFVKENIVSLGLLCFFYIIFSNYLLGVSFRNPKIKRSSSKYLKIILFIFFYLIEIVVSFIYFVNTLYDYYFLSIVNLITLPITIYAYFILTISILDFCIYTTDNSDDRSITEGEQIDYF